jgi:hypothetical protein
MCGGIAGVLTLSLAPDRRRSLAAMLPYLLAYNAGRITSYSVAGALLGAIGQAAVVLPRIQQGQAWLSVVAGLFMIALGLYLGGWWRGLAYLEQAGGLLWRRIEPYGRRFLPVRDWRGAWLLGLLWGWLPCGLVYSMLVWALAAGSPAQGALLMASFGAGTLPTLLAVGATAGRLTRVIQNPRVRQAAGVLVLILAAVQLWLGIRML